MGKNLRFTDEVLLKSFLTHSSVLTKLLSRLIDVLANPTGSQSASPVKNHVDRLSHSDRSLTLKPISELMSFLKSSPGMKRRRREPLIVHFEMAHFSQIFVQRKKTLRRADERLHFEQMIFVSFQRSLNESRPHPF